MILDKLIKRFQNKGKIKLANKMEELDQKLLEVDVNDFIKNLGVNPDSTLIRQIRKIKHKPLLYPKDESKIQVLWWTAKRQAFQEEQTKFYKGILDAEDKLIEAVEEELNKRVLEAHQAYKQYPSEE